MCKGASIRQFAQKMLFCCTNISAETLLPILGYSFGIERHIFTHFCQLLLPLNSLDIMLWRQNVGEIDQRAISILCL
jgi:hypothetical protein